jgi:hypothetical protein
LPLGIKVKELYSFFWPATASSSINSSVNMCILLSSAETSSIQQWEQHIVTPHI